GVVRDCVGVVAGCRRDDAAPPLSLRERKELVQRPAFLEGGGELQVLELEVEFAAGEPGERLAGQARGPLDRPRDAARRGADGLQRAHCANVKGFIRRTKRQMRAYT